MIIAGVAIPFENWPAFGVLGCVVFTATASPIPLRYLLKRLFISAVHRSDGDLPLSQGFSHGWG